MPTPHGSRGGLASSADELRVPRRAPAVPAPRRASPPVAAPGGPEPLPGALAAGDAPEGPKEPRPPRPSAPAPSERPAPKPSEVFPPRRRPAPPPPGKRAAG
ncbi:hypothetical protein GCM10010249_54700 [Streptomyces roseolilacinus]|uniref:Uncharacterized protein n=1 Tax=Streptomyces roseolilacinus TaxID=66904 RepID=A0A918EN54_9ACTN|nr:hypothetical protein GCM10010249_54700 [Streptomyces roseolilacinus]